MSNDEQPLRRGWTTGACATAAAKSACTALLTGDFPDPVETALGNDVALVDNVNTFLSLGDGGTKANASQQSQNQRFLGDIFDHCFPSLKKI